ncbi:hypothetical protein PM082_006324 [Marasmius tenuissimus]|nr:hypothetical protein PM082_006324 [Marasmius tenuissimus]
MAYWLKYTHIAHRFVPQASYELAAPMDITSTPDKVTRVFMLFRGVNLNSTWAEGIDWAREDVGI